MSTWITYVKRMAADCWLSNEIYMNTTFSAFRWSMVYLAYWNVTAGKWSGTSHMERTWLTYAKYYAQMTEFFSTGTPYRHHRIVFNSTIRTNRIKVVKLRPYTFFLPGPVPGLESGQVSFCPCSPGRPRFRPARHRPGLGPDPGPGPARPARPDTWLWNRRNRHLDG